MGNNNQQRYNQKNYQKIKYEMEKNEERTE